jgi:hypothetical protein
MYDCMDWIVTGDLTTCRLDLWERVREYDARSAAEASEGSMQVLTRNQKQKVKVKQVLNQQPSKPRARGDRKPPSQ